jgi:plastocyanin
VLLFGGAALLAAPATAARAGGGYCGSMATTTRAGAIVELRDNCFEPTVLTVRQGQQVTWSNHDSTPHTVTGAALTWGSGEPFAGGQVVSAVFDRAGIYPYACTLHLRWRVRSWWSQRKRR